MDTSRFDLVSRLFGERRLSRRQALVGGAATVAASTLATTSVAQDATPDASPMAAAPKVEKTMYLFVQSFQSGTLEPNADNDFHTLTLGNGLGQTLYFGDRPSRDVGAAPTDTFLQGLGFSADNPPNAALIVDAGEGETDLAVLELFEPSYDTETHTAAYQVRGLEAWEDSLQLGLEDTPSDLSAMAATFGAAHLLIDDCADGPIGCYNFDGGGWGESIGSFQGQGMCYNYLVCMPCEPYGHVQPDRCSTSQYWSQKCYDTFANGEQMAVASYFDSADLLGCTDGSTPSDW
jgi:hypothetical protein